MCCRETTRSQVIDFQCPGRRWLWHLTGFFAPAPSTNKRIPAVALVVVVALKNLLPKRERDTRLSTIPSRDVTKASAIDTGLIDFLFFSLSLSLQLLLEYDDLSWDQREWTSIHQTGVFHVFLVEHDLWWAEAQQQLWPALVILLQLLINV